MVGLLFPGQGAQAVGMGKELAENYPVAKSTFISADQLLGFSLSKLCWEGPAEELTRTENCQPALYVASMAALAALQSELKGKGKTVPAAVAGGLSLGEYTALAAAEAFSFADGLKLVRLRGQAMEEASKAAPGTMASILGIELPLLEELCRQTGAQVANLNSPGQMVISGTPESVAAASAAAKEKGAKRVIPLEVAGAFHSRLMEPAARKLGEALESAKIRPPVYPVVSNTTGGFHGDAAQIRHLLIEQLTQPVQWVACVKSMLGKGVRTYLELGTGGVLKGLMRKIDPEATVHTVGTAEEVRQTALALTNQTA